MRVFGNNDQRSPPFRIPVWLAGGILPLLILLPVFGFVAYNWSRVYVPAKHIAVMTKKTGLNLTNEQEVAPDASYKGIQLEILAEGRHFRNPYLWDWSVYPMVEVPENRMGVRIRLYGKDLEYGEFVAHDETWKGIVAEELPPGRYPINAKVVDTVSSRVVQDRPKNDYVEIIELHSPVTIPAGYKGVVTNLSGPMPVDPNQLLVEDGFRGVQQSTLDEGTYYMNPYTYRIELIDCRSQRFNLSEGFDMGFPSKDGFWVSLDGVIEFRVKPELASKVYVTYNETENDDGDLHDIDKEIIRKVIMPNARSFCRLQGANSSGRDFIGGETRTAFQTGFQNAIRKTCEAQGIEIVQALITKINPPQAIAGPVRDREVAAQQLKQYHQQQLQQEQEAKLATEVAMVSQLQKLVDSQLEVIKLTTDAQKRQEVAIAEATRDKEVAVEELAAAKDLASAIMATKSAEAKVIEFENEADAAGWKRTVEALGGDGSAYARYVMYQKLAPGYHSIMSNTADSPLMNVFRNMSDSRDKPADVNPPSDE